MAELQRSVTTFRRSGSSGLVWDERLFSGEADQTKEEEEEEEDDEDEGAAAASAAEFRELRHSKSVGSIGMMARSRSTGSGRHAAFRASIVPPAADPPSPDVPRCCGFFRKHRSAETSRPRRR